jgi:hypothetical protein
LAENPTLLLVGGFLGSGKTTLLIRAAAVLRSAGLRVAWITNDQGGSLVDTRLAVVSGIDVEEVVGGCFCCRFGDFVGAAERLRSFAPDVILAEPVGSCIDIARTILEPLKQQYASHFRLAPLTVLVDPQRAEELLAPDADPHLAYLFINQLHEADQVCFSKADMHVDFPELPTGFAPRLSGVTGDGVPAWLNEMLGGTKIPGSHLLNVDYRRYAAAEAALGWLNWEAKLTLDHAMSPAAVVGPFLDDLDQALTKSQIAILHLKVFDRSPAGYVKASICRNGDEPFAQGALDASPVREHELVLNLRARSAPELMEAIVGSAAAKLPGAVALSHFESFAPIVQIK